MTRSFALIVFGATGDLMHRKLIPSLYRLFVHGHISRMPYLIGVGRRPLDTKGFVTLMEKAVRVAEGENFDLRMWEKIAPHILYEQGMFEHRHLYDKLSQKLIGLHGKGHSLSHFFYLATPPTHYETIITNLGKSKLTKGRDGSFTRILIEKPFGKDLETAKRLDLLLAKNFDEKEIYRIDHYLGKETAQNIMAFRFANGIFEPTWNKDFIDHVQISLIETIGVGDRGAFYDGVGALRDVVQNHMLQMLALVAMDQPRAFDAQSIRDERAKILKSIEPFTTKSVKTHTVKGQYKGYTGEHNVNSNSHTETYAAVKLELASKRWKGVPFYLRTGKRLGQKVTEISLHYKKPVVCYGDVCLFNEEDVLRNVLSIRIQPNDAIRLRVMVKKPGFGMKLTSTGMHFQYKEAFPDFSQPEAYEKLLLDAINGDQILFARTDAIEASWNIITSILDGWKKSRVPLHIYEPGSMGPAASDMFIEGDGRRWFLSEN